MSTDTPDFDIRHNRDAQRFEAEVDDHLALLEYRRRDDRIIYTHTGVPEPIEDQGIGTALVKAGLEYARDHDLKVVPRCPFVAAYIDRHAKYQDLVA